METPQSLALLVFRDYRPSDLEGCLEVFDSNIPEYFSESEREDFVGFLDRIPGRYAVVCNAAGHIVACGGLAPSRTDPHAADLTWGMVRHDLHRQGIGRLLTVERLAWARAIQSVSRVCLNTAHTTEGFYKLLGFRTLRQIVDGYRKGLHRCDMQWERNSDHREQNA